MHLSAPYRFLLAVLTLACAAQAAPIRIACVGDSITYGAAVKDRAKNCYPAVLQRHLGSDYQVRNFGVNGATMLKKGDKPYWNLKAYKDALAFNPDVVFIKLGTNDSKPQNWKHKAEYAKDYAAMIAAFRSLAAKPRVILLLPVPVVKLQWGINPGVIQKEALPTIRNLAYEHNCEVVDLYQLFTNRLEELPDNVHPNAAGAARIADRLAAYLARPTTDFTIDANLPPGTDFNFHGYRGTNFNLDNVPCKIVRPRHAAPGNPWIWRARFFGHQPQLDVALLELGYHVAYCEVGNLFGNQTAVDRWNSFHHFATKAGLAQKPALEGMSRGGLIIWNWAKANPDKVACIYGDNAVCDIRSWPAGKGKGKGHAGTWKTCMKAHGITEESAANFTGNPIDNLDPVAKAKIPALHLVGTADDVVPHDENTTVLAERYRALGGPIEVIEKPGLGHHPHALPNPEPLVEFILKHDFSAPEFHKPFVNPIDNPLLPRVLLIGDSISIAYTPTVRRQLKGIANVHRVKANCAYSANGVTHVASWLGDGNWDLIHFNFGLWDWYGWKQDRRPTATEYAANLDKIVAALKPTVAKLIFATTTPPCAEAEHKIKVKVTPEQARAFNQAAADVMTKHTVTVNDLYFHILPHQQQYTLGKADVHWNHAGNRFLGEQVATKIADALPQE